MGHSRSSLRYEITSALILIGLLTVMVGPGVEPGYTRLRTVTPARTTIASGVKAEAPGSSVQFSGADRQTRDRVKEAYGKLPLRFEANAGQTDARVKFLSRGNNHSLFLTPTEAVLAPRHRGAGAGIDHQSIIRMKLAGAGSAPRMEGVDPLPGKSHYFIGNDPGRWRRNVTSYARVRYRSVYPGIDLIYYGNQQQLEYDFIVAPGGDSSAIRLRFDGAKQIEVDPQGDLVIHTASGEVRQRRPFTYQERNGRREEIASRYLLTGRQEVRFELGAYDRARPLVIDPVLAYSTFLGGSDLDSAYGIAVDRAGYAYVTGGTNSTDFPTVDPVQPNRKMWEEVFITKLNREGSALIYSTYLGGSESDRGLGIALDQEGNIYVGGQALSTDFPTLNALQPGFAGGLSDGFVAKLDRSGSNLLYSTYLGGGGLDYVYKPAVDTKCNVYLTGATQSTDFPTRDPLQPALAGSDDAFVTKLDGDGSAIIYSTYLGGHDSDISYDIAVDGSGDVYLAGTTLSTDFPTANPFQPNLNGVSDAFVTKLDSSGRTLVYSTYLGGKDDDEDSYSSIADSSFGLALDREGNLFITGVTYSTDFPTVNPLQPVYSGGGDAFVARFDRTGSRLIYSTYLGGNDWEEGSDIEVDPRGLIYVAGLTYSPDFPTTDALQPIPEPPTDGYDRYPNGFAFKLNAEGTNLIYSTYLGGNRADFAWGLAVDRSGNAYVVGGSGSDDLPTTPGAFHELFRGPDAFLTGGEAFILKIGDRRHRRDHALTGGEQ